MREVPEISDAMMAFPAINESTEWVPAYADIPDEFKRGHGKWSTFFADLFFRGVKDLKISAKEDIDPKKAWRALTALRGTFGLKHEHKEAAFAFLASEWLEDVEYKTT